MGLRTWFAERRSNKRAAVTREAILSGAAREHDFSRNRWGWAINHQRNLQWDGWACRASWQGHSDMARIKVGDTVLTPMQSGKTMRWRVDTIRYERDPADMFWAETTAVEYVQ